MMNTCKLAHCLLLVLLVTPLKTSAAKQDTSSRRESAAIEAIRAAGGRVTKIAADTEDREITFSRLGDKIKDEHVTHVPAVSNVVWLSLSGTGISDSAVNSLKGMKLQKLHLEKTAVGDAACKTLADMTSLTYLNLYSTKVTDEGLTHLTGLENLQQLHLWKSAATKEGVARLTKALPKLIVTGFPEPKMASKEKPKAEKKPAEQKDSSKEKSKPAPASKPPADAKKSADRKEAKAEGGN